MSVSVSVHLGMESRQVLLRLLRDSPLKLREHLLLSGPPDIVLAVCELALNVKSGNVKAKLTKEQSQFILQLVDRLVPLHRKRRFLAQKPAGRSLLRLLLNKIK